MMVGVFLVFLFFLCGHLSKASNEESDAAIPNCGPEYNLRGTNGSSQSTRPPCAFRPTPTSSAHSLNLESNVGTTHPTCQRDHYVRGVEDILSETRLPPYAFPPFKVCVKAEGPSRACPPVPEVEESQVAQIGGSELVVFAYVEAMVPAIHRFEVPDMGRFKYCHVFTPCEVLKRVVEQKRDGVYTYMKLDVHARLRGDIRAPVQLSVTASFQFADEHPLQRNPALGVHSVLCHGGSCIAQAFGGRHNVVKTQVLTLGNFWPSCSEKREDARQHYDKDTVFALWVEEEAPVTFKVFQKSSSGVVLVGTRQESTCKHSGTSELLPFKLDHMRENNIVPIEVCVKSLAVGDCRKNPEEQVNGEQPEDYKLSNLKLQIIQDGETKELSHSFYPTPAAGKFEHCYPFMACDLAQLMEGRRFGNVLFRASAELYNNQTYTRYPFNVVVRYTTQKFNEAPVFRDATIGVHSVTCPSVRHCTATVSGYPYRSITHHFTLSAGNWPTCNRNVPLRASQQPNGLYVFQVITKSSVRLSATGVL